MIVCVRVVLLFAFVCVRTSVCLCVFMCLGDCVLVCLWFCVFVGLCAFAFEWVRV